MTTMEVLNSLSIRLNFDIERLQQSLDGKDERLRSAFITYVNEALFFNSVLEDDLSNTKHPASVLEVGAGIGLLSMLVALRGFEVVAYEPESEGFDLMGRIRQILIDCWTGPNTNIMFINDFFTMDVAKNSKFEFAFAINVIEHVPDPESLIQTVTSALSSTGRARFICPNYDFPYEPHIGIPTVWSKQLTKGLFRRPIDNFPIENIAEFWNDLSWPSVRTLQRNLGAIGVNTNFGRQAMNCYVNRLISDSQFVERKGTLFRLAKTFLGPILSMGAKIAPVKLLPIIDLTTRRTSED